MQNPIVPASWLLLGPFLQQVTLGRGAPEPVVGLHDVGEACVALVLGCLVAQLVQCHERHGDVRVDELLAASDGGQVAGGLGGCVKTDSHLEYDESTNTYLRYVPVDGTMTPFREQHLSGTHYRNKGDTTMIDADRKDFGDTLSFTNVIIQQIHMSYRGAERPDPTLKGSGKADFFIGGKHFEGLWDRKDYNARTVFYGPDGNEMELMPGKTLIILMENNYDGRSVKYE